MAEEKVSKEEFREIVLKHLRETYMPNRPDEYRRELVYGEKYRHLIEDEYNHERGIEYGARNAAYTIGMLE